MAKRALGALPTVEPRSAPLFAPLTAGLAGAEAPAFGIQEVHAEVESSRGGVDRSQRSREPLRVEDSRRNQPGENLQELPVRGAARPQSSAPARMDASSSESAVTERPSAQTQIARGAAERSGAATENLANQQQPRSEQHTGEYAGKIDVEEEREAEGVSEQRKTAAPTTGAHATAEMRAAGEMRERLEERQDAPFTSTLIERIVEVEKHQEQREEAEPLARPQAKAVPQRPPAEQRIAARNETNVSASDAPAEQKTEIHISIGSIELRAPRTEARPQAAPFRPRVTLNEFLRRKPEARQ
jgi:hypothetical protein